MNIEKLKIKKMSVELGKNVAPWYNELQNAKNRKKRFKS